MSPHGYDRPRLLGDFAGAFGDLGTLLPLALGAMTLAGLPASGVLTGFGLAYALSALVYRAPIPVQPMKVAAAVLLATTPPVETVVAAGLVLGGFFLVAGASGLIGRIAAWIPETVTAGLQIGLGGTLGWMALTQIAQAPAFGLVLLLAMAALLWLRPQWPVAVILLVGGIGVGVLLGLVPGGTLPMPEPGWPALYWPNPAAFVEGTLTIALPQLPLTLTNAILVMAVMGRECFPQARHLDATHLSLTTGAINLATAPLGALPMCHGAGGAAAHHRFGARTGRAPALLGAILLTLGLVWGEAAVALLARVPTALLGVLLLVPALDLIRTAQPWHWFGWDRMLVLAIAVLAVWSPGIAFLAGLLAALALGCTRSARERNSDAE
ncbi:MAG: putative sulfate/molybdate transporter [Halofilum sp. (in: g-proteobacteria)]